MKTKKYVIKFIRSHGLEDTYWCVHNGSIGHTSSLKENGIKYTFEDGKKEIEKIIKLGYKGSYIKRIVLEEVNMLEEKVRENIQKTITHFYTIFDNKDIKKQYSKEEILIDIITTLVDIKDMEY